MFSKILVPIDGSETARRGLQVALDLAQRLNAQLTLLHVMEFYPLMVEMVPSGAWTQVTEGVREFGQQLLDDARQKALAQGIATDAFLLDASGARVADTITEQARQHGCDLIVMGTHGRRGLQRTLVGSDAELVGRHSAVPVMLVPQAS
ncbi:MAG: universal stress protein [Rubrivivax sp.]|nr:universal stress protein [Rubrivivax sp.]MDH5338597.1 universal stress protein [Rubrivivax sp.]